MSDKETLGATDYVVLSSMLAASTAIGVWHAWRGGGRSSSGEYALAGRSMRFFPVAMSVLATSTSAVTVLGVPAEVYRFTTEVLLYAVGISLALVTTMFLYLPVFHKLGLTSIYEYLESRFNRPVRIIGSAIFILAQVMILPICSYAPALALAEVTDLPLSSSIIVMGLICTFYTSIGGLKAVIWTDVLQVFVTYTSILLVLGKGVSDVGGAGVVWQKALDKQRIELFDFDVDPTTRHTFWSLIIGGFLLGLTVFATNQPNVQRYLAIDSLKGARLSLWVTMLSYAVLYLLCVGLGITMTAYYAGCDPIGTGRVQSPDQILPRFVLDIYAGIPGVAGFFVAGVFSASLSVVSSLLNALAVVTMQDIVQVFVARNMSESRKIRVTTLLSVVYGLLTIALVFLAQTLDGIWQATLTVWGSVGGPTVGLFTLAFFVPFTNSWGAVTGLLAGVCTSLWIGSGSWVARIRHQMSPMSYDLCPEELYRNLSSKSSLKGSGEDVFVLYRLSYLWPPVLAFVITVAIGSLVSFVSGRLLGSPIETGESEETHGILLSTLPKNGEKCEYAVIKKNLKEEKISTTLEV